MATDQVVPRLDSKVDSTCIPRRLDLPTSSSRWAFSSTRGWHFVESIVESTGPGLESMAAPADSMGAAVESAIASIESRPAILRLGASAGNGGYANGRCAAVPPKAAASPQPYGACTICMHFCFVSVQLTRMGSLSLRRRMKLLFSYIALGSASTTGALQQPPLEHLALLTKVHAPPLTCRHCVVDHRLPLHSHLPRRRIAALPRCLPLRTRSIDDLAHLALSQEGLQLCERAADVAPLASLGSARLATRVPLGRSDRARPSAAHARHARGALRAVNPIVDEYEGSD